MNYAIEFTTRALPCFTELYFDFYPNKIKIVPNNIYELLTPVAIAHIIMGDGRYASGVLICTDSYTIQDVIKLMNVFIIKYGLACTLRKHNKNQYRIYIRKQSLSLLIALVKPYMFSSFYYKLGLSETKNSELVVNLPKVLCSEKSQISLIKPLQFKRKFSLLNKNICLTSSVSYTYNSNYMLNSYLAGLIENSGTLVVPKDKVKPCLPKLLILFKLWDYHLVNELIAITKMGSLCKLKSSII